MKTKFKDFLLYSLACVGAVSLFLSTSYKQGLVENGRYNISTTTTKGQAGLVYETILDTQTGKVISRNKIGVYMFNDMR
tara:strand:- start:499 stop:735 length:237 start_codon:yes stop_codon:yes gene_type:complete